MSGLCFITYTLINPRSIPLWGHIIMTLSFDPVKTGLNPGRNCREVSTRVFHGHHVLAMVMVIVNAMVMVMDM